MKNLQGRWMLHEIGSAKINVCAQAFFSACTRRLSPSPLSESKYLPWMASPVLAKLAIDEMSSNVVQNHSIIDFSREYLTSISTFVSKAISSNILSAKPNVIIFEDIVEKAPKSIEVYRQALELVETWDDWQKNLFHAVIRSIVPVCKKGSNRETGEAFSDHHFIGAIFTSAEYQFPYPELSLNISFAHELGHQALMIYQHSGDLLYQSEAWVYSGVRQTLRPVVSALHAAVALSYMIEAIKALLANTQDAAKSGYLYVLLEDYTKNLRLGLSALQPLPKSDLCENILRDMELILQ